MGPALLRFGEAQQGERGCVLPVKGGLLTKREAGGLWFRWSCSGGQWRFETEVKGFYPSLTGPGATWLGRQLYRCTQQLVHGWVMRRIHREEIKLLEQEPRTGGQM
jgi:hypothetical protein